MKGIKDEKVNTNIHDSCTLYTAIDCNGGGSSKVSNGYGTRISYERAWISNDGAGKL